MNLNLDPEQFRNELKENNLYYETEAVENSIKLTLPDGVSIHDWCGGKTDLHIDHVFPLDAAISYDNLYPGLMMYAESPENLMFLSQSINQSKSDKIILELIPKNCPGYPFVEIKDVYQTIEEAGLPREPFLKWLAIVAQINAASTL